jgi:hypothetical protein
MLSPVESLSLGDIDQLIADHWREIRGLIREKRRRHTVSDTYQEPLDTGCGNGRVA